MTANVGAKCLLAQQKLDINAPSMKRLPPAGEEWQAHYPWTD